MNNDKSKMCEVFPSVKGLIVTDTPTRKRNNNIFPSCETVGPSILKLIDDGFLTKYNNP